MDGEIREKLVTRKFRWFSKASHGEIQILKTFYGTGGMLLHGNMFSCLLTTEVNKLSIGRWEKS